MGVVVRLFDYSSEPSAPWRNCPKPQCSYGDRLTGSVINSALPAVYSLWDSSNAGWVFAPREAQLHIQCSFARDGYTFNIFPGGCPDASCDDQSKCGVFYCHSPNDEFAWK